MSQVSRNKARRWDIVEALSLFASVGGSIVAITLQQTALAIAASLPLSVAMGLNLLSRRQLEKDIHQHKATIAQIERQHLEKFKYLDQAIQLLPPPINNDELKIIVDRAIEEFNKEINGQSKSLESTERTEFQEIENKLSRLFLFQDSIYNRLRFLESLDLSSIEETVNLLQEDHSALQKDLAKLAKETKREKSSTFDDVSAVKTAIQRIGSELNTNKLSLAQSLSDLVLRIEKLEALLVSSPPPPFENVHPHVEKILGDLGNQVRKLPIKRRTESSPPIVGVHGPQLLEYVSQDEIIRLVRQIDKGSSQRNSELIVRIRQIFEEEINKFDGIRFKSGAYNKLYLLRSQVIELIEDLKHRIR